MEKAALQMGLVLLLALVAGASYAKTSGPNYYTPEQTQLARQRVSSEDWARSHVESLKSRVAYLMELSDEELWGFIPPAQLTRATFLWRGQGGFPGCPICGKQIFKVGGGFYPWKYDREHPWKVQCPSCGTWFPTNDFATYYTNDMQGQCDMSGDFPDDGSGWKDENGLLHYFVGHWCQHQRWADVIRAIGDLGELFLLTEDATYARAGAILLSRFATVYPDMDYPKQSNYSADGRVLPWCWENTSVVMPVAIAYDSLWPYMHATADQGLLAFLKSRGFTDMCAHVDRGFLQDVADKMMTTDHYISNEGDHQRAFAIVALVWGDNDPAHGITTDQMLDWLIDGRGSMDTLIWNGIYPDGHPNEASPGYSSAVAAKSWEIADYLTHAGHNLFDNPRFPVSAHIWLDLTICGKQQPAIGDYGSIFGGGRAGWSAELFRAAWERYHDPRFAKALVAIGNPRPSLYQTDIRDQIAATAAAYDKPLVAGTRNLSQFGCAILESHAEEPNQRGLSLYYGSAAGGHGHYDRLNIELYAHGHSLMPDLGYPDQWGAKAQHFHGNSTAHYVVQIDERGQTNKERGRLKFVADLAEVQVVEASAERTYPDLADTYRRTTALVDLSATDFYVCDIFRVKGGSRHDWLFHGPPYQGFSIEGVNLSEPRAGTLAGPDVELGAIPEGYQRSGYQWLHSVQSGRPAGEWSVSYSQADDPQLRMTMLPGAASEIFVGRFDSPNIKSDLMPDTLPWVVARNQADDASCFTSIIRALPGQDCVEKIEPLPLSDNAAQAVAVRVTTADYVDTLYSSLDGEAELAVGDDLKAAARFVLLRRDRRGNLVSVHTVGCNRLTAPDLALQGQGRYQGTVTAVDPDTNTVTVAGLPFSSALVGQSVIFANDLHETNFQVEAVSQTGGQVTLSLGYVSPLIGHGTVLSVDDETGVMLTDTTFRNYGSHDIWAKGFDPKLEGMYLVNADRSRHFLINDCQLFPDVAKDWWQPEAEHGSFNLVGEKKLSEAFRPGDDWYVQALWPGDAAWLESAMMLQVHQPRIYRLITPADHVILRLPDATGKAIYKAVGEPQGAYQIEVQDGRVELDAKVLRSGQGWVVLNPDPNVDYDDTDPPRLVRISADGHQTEYQESMDLAALDARKLQLVIEDASRLEPFEITLAGLPLSARGPGISVEKLSKTRTALTLEPQALAAQAMTEEIAYPPLLKIAVRDRALNPEPCRLSLTLGNLAAAAEGAVFLSDLEPLSARCHAGLIRDQNYARQPGVTLRGTHFAKSLMTHALKDGPAEVIYDLTPYPNHRLFRAIVGVDDETGTLGSVTFEVHVDAPDGGWRKLHATGMLAGGGEVKALTIDLGQAEKLRLLVTDAGDSHGSDHAVWANARLEARQ